MRAADLARELEVSIPTLHRLLAHEPPAHPGRRQGPLHPYALRRSMRGDPGEYPLDAVDASGRATQVARLSALAPAGSNSSTVRRWADLLVCEHLALDGARALPGLASALSRVLAHAGRTFLEVERFDRHGAFGRSPLVACLPLTLIDGRGASQPGSAWSAPRM